MKKVFLSLCAVSLVLFSVGCAVQNGGGSGGSSSNLSGGGGGGIYVPLPPGGTLTRLYGYAAAINCVHVQAPIQMGQSWEIVCHDFIGTAEAIGGATETLDHRYVRIVFDQIGVDSQAAAMTCWNQLEPKVNAGLSFQVFGLRTTDSSDPMAVVLHETIDCTQ